MIYSITITSEKHYKQAHTSMINALNHMLAVVHNGGYCFIMDTMYPASYPMYTIICDSVDKIKAYHKAVAEKDLQEVLKAIEWLDALHEKQRINALAELKRRSK